MLASKAPHLRDRLRDRSLVGLSLIGIASASIYLFFFTLRFPLPSLSDRILDLGSATGHSPEAGAAYLGVVAVLFLLYFAALAIVRRVEPRRALPVVAAFSGACGGILLPLYPIWAIDLYIYGVYGRIWAHYGENPMVVTLEAFAMDPYSTLVGPWEGSPPVYGPLWIALSGLYQQIASGDVLGVLLIFKITALLSYLGCTFLIWQILARVRPRDRAVGTLFFAGNPMVLLEVVGHGHNDATMMLFVLAAIALALSPRRSLSLPAVGLAVLTKYTLGVLGPLFLVHLLQRRERWASRLLTVGVGGALGIGVLALGFAPFWAGPDTFRGVLEEGQRVFGAPGAVLYCASEWGLVPPLTLEEASWVFVGLFAMVYLGCLALLLRRPDLWLAVAFEVAFWLLFALPHIQSWYLVWPLALAPLVGRAHALWRIGTFSFTTLLGVFVFGYLWVWQMPNGWSSCEIHAVYAPTILLPPLAVSAGFLWRPLGASLVSCYHRLSSSGRSGRGR